jgi:hypothetical protein
MVKVSYEVMELETFNEAVDAVKDALFAAKTLLAAGFDLGDIPSELETRLEDAKSELAMAQAVAADAGPGSSVDAGQGGASSEVAAEEPRAAQVA